MNKIKFVNLIILILITLIIYGVFYLIGKKAGIDWWLLKEFTFAILFLILIVIIYKGKTK